MPLLSVSGSSSSVQLPPATLPAFIDVPLWFYPKCENGARGLVYPERQAGSTRRTRSESLDGPIRQQCVFSAGLTGGPPLRSTHPVFELTINKHKGLGKILLAKPRRALAPHGPRLHPRRRKPDHPGTRKPTRPGTRPNPRPTELLGQE